MTLTTFQATPNEAAVTGASPAGHDQKMIELVDKRYADAATAAGVQPTEGAKPAEGVPQETRPSWLPEKFKSPEDMAKAYAELERKLHSGAKEPPKPAEAPPADAPKPAEGDQAPADGDQKDTEGKAPEDAPKDEEAKEAIEKAGLDFDDLARQVESTGTITEDSYAALEKAGIPRAYVDAYIEGQQAKAELMRAEMLSSVGGESAYAEMTAWAASNFTTAEIEAYNRVTASGDREAVQMAVHGLKARFEAANGAAPKLVTTAPVQPAGSTIAFANQSEMMRAMQDPRYGRDPGYTRDVEQRVFHSKFI